MAKCRIQLLLEEQRYDRLRDIADTEGTSISAVARSFVERGLKRSSATGEPQRQWMHRAGELRRRIRHRNGIYAGDPVAEARAERECEMEAVLQVVESPGTRIHDSLLDLKEGHVSYGSASDVVDDLND